MCSKIYVNKLRCFETFRCAGMHPWHSSPKKNRPAPPKLSFGSAVPNSPRVSFKGHIMWQSSCSLLIRRNRSLIICQNLKINQFFFISFHKTVKKNRSTISWKEFLTCSRPYILEKAPITYYHDNTSIASHDVTGRTGS